MSDWMQGWMGGVVLVVSTVVVISVAVRFCVWVQYKLAVRKLRRMYQQRAQRWGK